MRTLSQSRIAQTAKRTMMKKLLLIATVSFAMLVAAPSIFANCASLPKTGRNAPQVKMDFFRCNNALTLNQGARALSKTNTPPGETFTKVSYFEANEPNFYGTILNSYPVYDANGAIDELSSDHFVYKKGAWEAIISRASDGTDVEKVTAMINSGYRPEEAYKAILKDYGVDGNGLPNPTYDAAFAEAVSNLYDHYKIAKIINAFAGGKVLHDLDADGNIQLLPPDSYEKLRRVNDALANGLAIDEEERLKAFVSANFEVDTVVDLMVNVWGDSSTDAINSILAVYDYDQVANYLFDEGFSNNEIESLLYQTTGSDPFVLVGGSGSAGEQNYDEYRQVPAIAEVAIIPNSGDAAGMEIDPAKYQLLYYNRYTQSMKILFIPKGTTDLKFADVKINSQDLTSHTQVFNLDIYDENNTLLEVLNFKAIEYDPLNGKIQVNMSVQDASWYYAISKTIEKPYLSYIIQPEPL